MLFYPTTSGVFAPNSDFSTGYGGVQNVAANSGEIDRWESRPTSGYFAPGSILWSGQTAPISLATVTTIAATMTAKVILPPDNYQPLWTLAVSADNGTTFHNLTSLSLPTTPTAYTLDITSLLGSIPSYNFNNIVFSFSCGSSIFESDSAPGAQGIVSAVGLNVYYSGADPLSGIIDEQQIDARTGVGNSFVRFRLRGVSAGVPRWVGSPVTVTGTIDGGSISQSIIPNSAITPVGSFYSIEAWANGRIVSSANATINSSVDLATLL